MKKTYLLLPLLFVVAFSFSQTAQTEDKTEVSAMLNLLEPGQYVSVTKTTFGYKIQSLTPEQVEQWIDQNKLLRAEMAALAPASESGTGGRVPEQIRTTPRELFERTHSVVKAVTQDHVTLLGHDIVSGVDTVERYIASRAIVEIYRYSE